MKPERCKQWINLHTSPSQTKTRTPWTNSGTTSQPSRITHRLRHPATSPTARPTELLQKQPSRSATASIMLCAS